MSLSEPGYIKSQYEYNDVLASNVTAGYKRSSNHAVYQVNNI